MLLGFIATIGLFFSYNKIKTDLFKVFHNKYKFIQLDDIIVDKNELHISFYIEGTYECLRYSLKIRNIVKDYLKKHDEYRNMRVEIFLITYANDFSITFANYDEDDTGIEFENSYDINYGRFSCANYLSLSDFKGIEDFEILRFAYLNDYSDVSALDSVKDLRYLVFSDFGNQKKEKFENIDYNYLSNMHPNCKIEID